MELYLSRRTLTTELLNVTILFNHRRYMVDERVNVRGHILPLKPSHSELRLRKSLTHSVAEIKEYVHV